MANNQSNAAKLKAEKAKADKLADEKGKTYKVKKDLGFTNGKRNYYIGTKNYLLIEGGEVEEEIYLLFGEHAQKAFFED